MKPHEAFKGNATEEIVVRTLGTPKDDGALTLGSTRLLYLKEFTFEPGTPTGEYVVTGVYSGDYLQTETNVFTKTATEAPELPVRVSRDEASAAL